MSKQKMPEETVIQPKPRKTRSPGYPAFDLAVAIGKLPALYAAMKRHEVAGDTVISAMGFSHKGSTGKLAIAALRSFGLIEGRGMMVKLSRRGLDLGVDYKPTDPQWISAAKEAALEPEMHRILWDRYGADLPVDDELRRFLVREHGFNDNTVGQFVADYKKTIAFAALANDGAIEKNEVTAKVGDLVQWTSQGVDQLPKPMPVVGIADGGEYAFVEGSDTGLPMSELTIVDPSVDAGNPKPPALTPKGGPPANPLYKPPALNGPRIEFPLPNDNSIEIRLKKAVSEKDFERIMKLVELSKESLVAQATASN